MPPQRANRIYRLTASGQAPGAGVPADYQRILRLIEGDTHVDVVRGYLRRFPDALLLDWLEELEEQGYVESRAAGQEADLDFTGPLSLKPAPAPELIPEDVKQIERSARSVGAKLLRSGAWIAEDRLKNRDPLKAAPAKTDVLIVEDDPDQLALAELRVKAAGYAVRTATRFKQALGELETQAPPDVLLLDVMLPDGDGFDLLTRIRRHPKLALMVVVMLTAKDSPQDVRHGLTLGADAYITKPYSKSVVVDTVRRVLKQPAPK